MPLKTKDQIIGKVSTYVGVAIDETLCQGNHINSIKYKSNKQTISVRGLGQYRARRHLLRFLKALLLLKASILTILFVEEGTVQKGTSRQNK